MHNLEKSIENKNISFNIYDIPGLNDARTKEVYFQYIDNNFHKFNIVMFIVDINSSLNSSDEIDILNLIIKNIKKHISKNIHILVLLNKADDMRLNDEAVLEPVGELYDMFCQAKLTVEQKFRLNNLTDRLIDIIPICALDAYLYRMLQINPSFELNKSQILKIGIDHQGKSFRNLSDNLQRQKINKMVANPETKSSMISQSGFDRFECTMIEFLTREQNAIIISNLQLDEKLDEYKRKFIESRSIETNIKLIDQIKDASDQLINIKCARDISQFITDIYDALLLKFNNYGDYKKLICDYVDFKNHFDKKLNKHGCAQLVNEATKRCSYLYCE